MPLPDGEGEGPSPDGKGGGFDQLHSLIRHQLDLLGHRDDGDVDRLLAAIHHRFGERVAAVLIYGSYLRGKRDTLVDFYVLLTDLSGALPRLHAWGNRWLPPNVYYVSLPADDDGPAVRAKYATMTLAQFESAMGDFHSYFWSRFTQPAGLAAVRDENAARRVTAALGAAVDRFVREAAPVIAPADDGFASSELWRRGLALTYRCELRSESPARVSDLYAHQAAHFDGLLAAYAADPRAGVSATAQGGYAVRAGATGTALRWRARRVQGKVLSVLRLVKAAGTFDDPLDYLLWKIERHSGVYMEPSDRQRRHPLVFAWPLLWRLYRRGAFR